MDTHHDGPESYAERCRTRGAEDGARAAYHGMPCFFRHCDLRALESYGRSYVWTWQAARALLASPRRDEMSLDALWLHSATLASLDEPAESCPGCNETPAECRCAVVVGDDGYPQLQAPTDEVQGCATQRPCPCSDPTCADRDRHPAPECQFCGWSPCLCDQQ